MRDPVWVPQIQCSWANCKKRIAKVSVYELNVFILFYATLFNKLIFSFFCAVITNRGKTANGWSLNSTMPCIDLKRVATVITVSKKGPFYV